MNLSFNSASLRLHASRIFRGESFHKRRQCLGAFQGHSVVRRCANAADGAVALECDHALFGGVLDEHLGDFFAWQAEGNVHATALRRYAQRALVKTVGGVDRVIDRSGFGLVGFFNRG